MVKSRPSICRRKARRGEAEARTICIRNTGRKDDGIISAAVRGGVVSHFVRIAASGINAGPAKWCGYWNRQAELPFSRLREKVPAGRMRGFRVAE